MNKICFGLLILLALTYLTIHLTAPTDHQQPCLMYIALHYLKHILQTMSLYCKHSKQRYISFHMVLTYGTCIGSCIVIQI